MSTKRSKEERRKEAEARQEERAKRTPQEQLARLDAMFGKDQGAARERERLQALIQGESNK